MYGNKRQCFITLNHFILFFKLFEKIGIYSEIKKLNVVF